MSGNAFVAGLATAIAVGWLALSASEAAAETCTTDRDCIEAGTACGSEVCNRPPSSDASTGECTPPVGGFSSYCLADTDCKCHAQGATCVMPVIFTNMNYPPYCSFSIPDGGAPVGLRPRDSDAGPASSDGGASTDEDAGATPVSAADASTDEPARGGGDDAATAAPDAAVNGAGSSSSGGSGCMMSPSESPPWAAAAGALGVAFALGRRRRRG